MEKHIWNFDHGKLDSFTYQCLQYIYIVTLLLLFIPCLHLHLFIYLYTIQNEYQDHSEGLHTLRMDNIWLLNIRS